MEMGAAPDEMLYKNQPGFIKFALGENVKQSNWELITQLVFLKLEWELSFLITFSVLENTKQLGNYTTLHLRKTKEKHQE
jgi:hypothetical protein